MLNNLRNKPFMCKVTGKHKWDRRLSDAKRSLFCRIDCERCGISVDGVMVLQLPESVREYMGDRLPT